MGRNAGSKIHWTHIEQGGADAQTFTWVCQQHAKFDHFSNVAPEVAGATLITHLGDHGNAEQ